MEERIKENEIEGEEAVDSTALVKNDEPLEASSEVEASSEGNEQVKQKQEITDTAVAETSFEDKENSEERENASIIEDMVRKVVDEKLAGIYPSPREYPSSEESVEELSAEEYLRLGYGLRTPHR